MTFRPPARPTAAAGLVGVLFTVLTSFAQADQPATPTAPKKITAVEGITEYRLDNGLRVLLFPDPSRPLVTVSLTVFVGSRHEGYGETGMAHLLEHMVFKGTPTYPDVPKALRDHGARFNGTTWVDRTNYFETMPASDENLEFGIRLEADRMVNSPIKREDLMSEFSVVRNEFERGENDPENILSQRMLATAYEWHNYGKSTIGNRSDIERVPVDNLRAFYKKYYQPDNAMLVVAGRFDEEKALAYAQKYLGAIPKPARELPRTYTEEPAQDGERTVVLRRVGTVAAAGVVYHVPAGSHPDFPAVEVLQDVLTSQPSGRLYKALVEPKLAASVGGSAFGWHDPGVVEIIATCEPDKLDRVREILVGTIDQASAGRVTADEVERSKRQFARRQEMQLAASDRLAVALSDWAAKGDWRLFFLHRDRMEKVTPADVERVARKYLVGSNRTVGVFVPQKPEQLVRADVPAAPSVAQALDGYKGRDAIAAGEAFDPTPENIERRLERATVGEGVKAAFLARKARGEVVNLALNLRFGSPESLAGKTTAARLLGEMLTRGTLKHSHQQLNDEFDKLGTRIDVVSSTGAVTAMMQTKRPNLARSLELLGEVLREPTFPADEFELLVRERRERLDKSLTEPMALAPLLMQRKLNPYPPTDVRYVPTIEEEIAQLDAVKLDDVRRLYKEQVGGSAGELAVVGDFDPAATRAQIDTLLKGWKSGTPFVRIERMPQAVGGGKTVLKTPDKSNAFYIAGLTFAVRDDEPEYAALEVGNYLLGGGTLSNRLGNRVRQKEGLSYGVASRFEASSLDKSARFTMYAICNPENIGKVDAAIGEELARYLKDGPSLGELNEGKSAYLDQLKVQRSSDAALASQISGNLYAGRTFAFTSELEKRITGLTPDAVKAAFQKFVDPKNLVTVEAGDFKK